MRVTIATEPAPGHINEDFAAANATSAVLLDGAGLSDVDDGGCVHGVAWYVRRLGNLLLAGLEDKPANALTAILAGAIDEVARAHRSTCDLSHPGTPSSTVVMVTTTLDTFRYLVLADSVLVLNGVDGEHVVSDDREAAVGRRHRTTMDAQAGGTPAHDDARRRYVEALRAYRNRPDGFWVAAATPDAARHALTGAFAFGTVRSALLLSDGASRLVDRFGLSTWSATTRLVAESGCEALIEAVRSAERSDPHGRRWPRGKIHDDATVMFCDQL